MTKRTSIIAGLLLSSALISPAAHAQSAPGEEPAAEPTSSDDEPTGEDVDVSAPGGEFSGEIIVRGKYIPNPVRATGEVVSVLGEAEIARTADGDIAGSLQRVTGLSVVGGRFVFVRGLGERYSLALLNGLPLPSPEPLRRVVPLDLFPTSVIASTVVQKSYSVNYPGEFGGGVISVGTTFTSEDLQNFAASLNNAETNLIQRNNDIPANFSADISAGKTFDVGDAYVGVVATAGYDNSWRTRGGVQQTSQGIVTVDGEPGLLPDQNFRFVTTENRIVINGLLGLSAEVGEHKFRFTNLYIHDTSKEASIKAGIDSINVSDDTLLNQGRTSWFERQLFTSQFVGEFKFDELSIDVRGSYANSKRDAPYERTYGYAYDDIIAQDYVNNLTSPGQSARIRFSDLNDDVYGAGADISYETDLGVPTIFSAGYSYYKNDRFAQRRDFRFVPVGNIPNPIDQERIDFLLSDYNVYTYGLELREVASQASVPAYSATLEVNAGYVSVEAELTDGLRANLGVRYEDAKQQVTPISLVGGTPGVGTGLNNDYWLPAGTLTWNFAEDMQFRLAASKTIARPQFRELAPQQFLDLESDRTFVGNPLLTDSELFNVEGRYEYYIGRGERITLAGFYKKIDNPIENVAFVQGGGTLFTGFSNAPTATLYGAEVELVKYLPLNDLGGDFFQDRRLMLAANYTYTKSKIKVDASDMSINPITLTPVASSNLFDDGDRLTGQSTHVGNFQFGMEREDGPVSQQTILLTYNSPRVTARGPQGQPDLIERTGWKLDVVLREEMNIAGQDFELKFESRNLLGTDYKESQTLGATEILNNAYDIGTRFSMSIGLNF